jgi:hypothetical protein
MMHLIGYKIYMMSTLSTTSLLGAGQKSLLKAKFSHGMEIAFVYDDWQLTGG